MGSSDYRHILPQLLPHGQVCTTRCKPSSPFLFNLIFSTGKLGQILVKLLCSSSSLQHHSQDPHQMRKGNN